MTWLHACMHNAPSGKHTYLANALGQNLPADAQFRSHVWGHQSVHAQKQHTHEVVGVCLENRPEEGAEKIDDFDTACVRLFVCA